jgi:hypothetical protein
MENQTKAPGYFLPEKKFDEIIALRDRHLSEAARMAEQLDKALANLSSTAWVGARKYIDRTANCEEMTAEDEAFVFSEPVAAGKIYAIVFEHVKISQRMNNSLNAILECCTPAQKALALDQIQGSLAHHYATLGGLKQ